MMGVFFVFIHYLYKIYALVDIVNDTSRELAMKFSQYITKELYNRLNKDYPKSVDSIMFRRFVLYLATGTNSGKDKDIPHLTISSNTCAILEQKTKDRHYS